MFIIYIPLVVSISERLEMYLNERKLIIFSLLVAEIYVGLS